MPSSEMSNDGSFYQLACYTTDTFTSCIRIYEDLLPYFEAETSEDGINERLFNIGRMLTTLYTELTTLKNEISTCTSATIVRDDKESDLSVESNSARQEVCEHNQQENISCDASTEEQKESKKGRELKKTPKRSWEEVKQVLPEEYEREKINHEDSKADQRISHDEKENRKPTENLKKHASDFVYKCGNCQEAITVYNQDLDLSIALHSQDGCCRGKPSKLIAVQLESQGEKLKMSNAQGQIENSTKFQKASNRLNLTPAQTNTAHKVGATRFSCIQPLGNMFLCTICNKKLSGPKVFDEHLTGHQHQTCLKEYHKEIQEKTVHEKNVTHASVQQKDSESSLDAHLFGIITHLSGSLPTQVQYLTVVKGVIMCNLCICPIPPTISNVRDHVLGSRHSNNQKLVQ